MNKRKYIAFLTCIVILIAVIVVFHIFDSRPIIDNIHESHIVRIKYNPHFKEDVDEFMDIVNYDEIELLNCLSYYTERRTLTPADGYWLGDVELEIIIHTKEGLKCIILGAEHYSYQALHPKYKIEDGEKLRNRLIALFDIPTVK